MAEQFLSRLTQIETKIEALGETLKRMITILSTITEVKSEVTQAKTEILHAFSAAKPTGEVPPSIDPTQIRAIIKSEIEDLRQFVEMSIEALREEITSSIEEIPTPAVVVEHEAPAQKHSTKSQAPPTAVMTSSLPADKAMQIAGHLDTIIKSLKMGCKSNDVQDAMIEAKESITKIVPSDPIMIKIDKWVGVVSAYPARKELQARDILKLKKEIQAEIESYSPA